MNNLEQLAKNGEPMPDNLPLAEQKFFQAMALLYARFRVGAIDVKQASAEKRQAYMAVKREIAEDNFRDKILHYSEKVNRMGEAARSKCRKNPTPECQELLDVLDGLSREEPAREVIVNEHGANCPVCERFFNQEHAFRRPRYCEDCGCRLGWND